MMRKLLTLAAAVLVSTGVFAQNQEEGVQGMGVSIAYNEMMGDDFCIGLDYKMPEMEMGVNGSAEFNKSVKTQNTKNWNELSLGAYLGTRCHLSDKLFGSLGVQGAYTFLSHKERYEQGKGADHNPYVVGAYVGLSYEPTSQVAIFARINAVSYETFGYKKANANGKQNEWEVFQEGTIGISYYGW